MSSEIVPSCHAGIISGNPAGGSPQQDKETRYREAGPTAQANCLLMILLSPLDRKLIASTLAASRPLWFN